MSKIEIDVAEQPPLTLAQALKSAIWWIETLCEELDVEPAETAVNVSAVKDGETSRRLATQTLAEALTNYKGAIERAEADGE